ncbi:MAG: glycine cleavage system protein GcvH [Verrucomicrobiales bacterium]|nr:glycine cleavage system protein GcvH [Verrucomicrobiales bacterium]
MNVPENLHYAESHEWVNPENPDAAPVGISDHAQAELSDVVYLELPAVGTVVAKGDSIAVIESVKAANDIYSPVSGEIVEVNEGLVEAPEPINADPYEAGWMVKIKLSDTSEIEGLLDSAAYQKILS